MLPTKTITTQINKGQGERFNVRSEAVGKACRSMGLETAHLPDKSGRGPKITSEFIEKIKNSLGNRPNRPVNYPKAPIW